MNYVMIWLGLGTANFLYEWYTKQRWEIAVRETVMQGVAILACVVGG